MNEIPFYGMHLNRHACFRSLLFLSYHILRPNSNRKDWVDVDKSVGGEGRLSLRAVEPGDFARRRRGGFVPSGCGGRISCSSLKKGVFLTVPEGQVSVSAAELLILR